MAKHIPRPGVRQILSLLSLYSFVTTSAASQYTPDPSARAINILSTPAQTCPLILLEDEVSDDPEDWLPWTHKPFCIQSEKHDKLRYCVYTTTNYGSNGISLITTPETASNTLTTEFLTEDPLEVFLLPHEPRSEWTDSQTGWGSTKRDGSPFEIVDIEGKGKGVVATRAIKKYETLVIERASIAADLEFQVDVRPYEKLLLLRKAAEQLVDPELVMRLGRSGPEEMDVVDDVMITNSFQVELSDLVHMTLFPGVSRLNHACDPNAFVIFSPAGLSIAVRAYRDIQPGEEVTISYIPMGEVFEERQKQLQRWGFTCNCSLCTSSEYTLSASDKRRKRITAKRTDFFNSLHEGKINTAKTLAHEILDLLEKEGMMALSMEMYLMLARIGLYFGEADVAEENGRLAADILRNHGFIREDGIPWNLDRLFSNFGGV